MRPRQPAVQDLINVQSALEHNRSLLIHLRGHALKFKVFGKRVSITSGVLRSLPCHLVLCSFQRLFFLCLSIYFFPMSPLHDRYPDDNTVCLLGRLAQSLARNKSTQVTSGTLDEPRAQGAQEPLSRGSEPS